MTPAARVGFYTDAHQWGGAEMVLQTLVASLPPAIEPVVVGPDAAVVGRLARAAGPACASAVTAARARSGIGPRMDLRRSLQALSLDLLHANCNRMTSCSEAILAAATLGLPAVAVQHTTIGPLSRAGALSTRALAGTLRTHVAVGANAARTVEDTLHLRPGTVRVIHNGVPDRGAARRGRAGAPVVLGTLGSGHPLKGLDVLLRALPAVPGARLVMVGAAGAAEELLALAAAAGVADRVACADWTPSPHRALAGFDVLVHPSRREGLPLAVLEAMMAGLPVVATDVGSVAEAVVDGRTGLLVPPEDPGRLAAALRAVTADPARRRAMGDAGRIRALAHFTTGEMVRRYVSLYQELLVPSPPVHRGRGRGRGRYPVRVVGGPAAMKPTAATP